MGELTVTSALILVTAGLACGTINAVAGGGSFLTLPVLIFLGLPPSVANATNRLGILFQNIGAVPTYRRLGVWEPGSLLWAALPACVGALVGVWAALEIPETAFQRLLALLMLVVLGVALWGPKPATRESAWSPGAVALAFFFAGIYGGFIQAGVGFFMLAATSFAGFDLVRGNSIKVTSGLCLSAVALALFAWNDKVVWSAGLFLGIGTLSGGILGARLSVLKGHAWVRWVVSIAGGAFAVKLLVDSWG